jgi:Zn finger protein HypA/HybF involved in hydrogenase expression
MTLQKHQVPKSKKKHKTVIVPVVVKCVDCKINRATDHHLQCNECRSKRDKARDKSERRKTVNRPVKNKKKRTKSKQPWITCLNPYG